MPPPRDELLLPLPGDAKGENLRYTPVYDKIKEARQEEEDESNQGEWQHARKKADVAGVIKLAGEALATKSKDLQLAVWLSEALIRKEGFAALAECLTLLRELQVRFWDTLYPEMEDGNPEFRATSQEWLAGRCDYLLRRIPLTKKGLDWFKYYEAHDTSRERAAMAGKGEEDQKREARDKAVAIREAAAQEFNESFEATPKSFYVAAVSHLDAAQEAQASLEAFCDDKYGNVSPNFSKLRNALEEVRQAVSELLNLKREKEPDEAPQAAPEIEPVQEAVEESVPAAAANTAKMAKPQPSVIQAKPTNAEEAYAAVSRAAECLRQLDASSAAPYLLVRSLRWAELRAGGDNLDPSLLVAPSTEIRQNLKRLFLDNNWSELLAAAEAAVILPCGRAWLDLHRYTCVASGEQGYSTVAKAICSELRVLIADFPSLPDALLDDDTPVAGPDTRKWLDEYIIPPKAAPEPGPVLYMPVRSQEPTDPDASAKDAPDPFETALQLAGNQRLPEAIELLTRHRVPDDCGREGFLRQLKISQLCLANGQFNMAYSILSQLFSEIKARELLKWESKNFLVLPLTLLAHCIDKTNLGAEQRAEIYTLLCRLDPAEAIKLQNS